MNINIKTERPVLLNDKMIANYSNADTGTPYGPNPTPKFQGPIINPASKAKSAAKPKAKKLANFGNKVKGALGKAKNSGFLQKAANLFLAPNDSPSDNMPMPTPKVGGSKPKKKEGMSIGVKIGIGVAVAGALSFIIYKVIKRKK